MRPPDLPGGNAYVATYSAQSKPSASMRPPDLPGGNNEHLMNKPQTMKVLQ